MSLGVGWSSQVGNIFQIKKEIVLFQGTRERTMCWNHRIIVLERQINSFAQSPGIDSFIRLSHRLPRIILRRQVAA